MTCAKATVVAKLIGGQDEFIAVSKVLVNEEVEKSPFKTCANSTIAPESVATEFDTTFIVDETKVNTEVIVALGFEVKCRLLSPSLHNLVVFLFTGEKVGVGGVGQCAKESVDVLDEFVDSFIALCNLLADFSHFLKDMFNGLALFFQFGDFC